MNNSADESRESEGRPQPAEPPDIFLSYAREDSSRANWIAKTLSDRGWSVWKDTRVGGGQLWKAEIAKALDAARCVVVLWSKASTESLWVLDEAGEGLRKGIIVPVLLDDVDIPLGFRQVQAVDLSQATADDHKELDDLAGAVSRVLGRPKVTPPRPPRALALSRRAAAVSLVVLPPAIVLLLHVLRADHTPIDLEARTSEVSFTLTEQQEVSDLVLASELEIAGVESIQVPHARDRAQRMLTATNGRSLAVRIAADDGALPPGTITLTPVSIAGGAHVTIAAAAGPAGYRIAFNRSAVPVQANVRGSLQVAIAGEAAERIDFGAPKPMVFEPDENGAEIGIRLKYPSQNLLPSSLVINNLRLFRIDERVQAGRTIVTTVPTVLSATLRLDAQGGRERAIGPGEGLRFGESRGELRALQLTDGALSMRFRGQVGQMEACSRTDCASWMPTYLESLIAQQRPWLVVPAVAYVLYLAAVGRRCLKRR